MFMDAIYLSVRPAGPREGVLVAWGFDLDERTADRPGDPVLDLRRIRRRID